MEFQGMEHRENKEIWQYQPNEDPHVEGSNGRFGHRIARLILEAFF
jgi:hypothetical protein